MLYEVITIKSVNRKEAESLIADGTISGGMIPKVERNNFV